MERCQICTDMGDDRRTLSLQYFYDLQEISPKFIQREIGVYNQLPTQPNPTLQKETVYTLRTCKDCRGEFLGLLRRWAYGVFINEEFRSGSEERNIPFRHDGRVIMLTQEEWEVFRARSEAKGEL